MRSPAVPSSLALLAALSLAPFLAAQHRVLIEAESFEQRGGWKLDTQFVEIVGSPYLLAHGLGVPVADARTEVALPAPGRYRVFVRTVDWVARWNAPGVPGRFRLLVNGRPLPTTFGTEGAKWSWHDGGVVAIDERRVDLALRDLTGFDGRCDAVYLTTDLEEMPPDEPDAPDERDESHEPGEPDERGTWRRRVLGLPDQPVETGPWDLVVVGGGYSGTATAISAARMGCRVALVQNRPVLGGNGSSEVRVWAQGGTRRGPYPRLGEIVEEFMDRATASPGTYDEFADARKERVVRAEPNIGLFLNHHVDAVEVSETSQTADASDAADTADTAGRRIRAVVAFDTRTSARVRFAARLFADCTGHGSIGALAGADHTVREKGHLGMSNMWRWEDAAEPTPFPDTPWALDLEMDDFPYPRRGLGEWFWESGFDRHPIHDLEYIRDWNLRAVFGAFSAMKHRGGRERHQNARLIWVAYVGGTRESRQLLGDVVLTRDDIVARRPFPDGCVPTTWDIDLHYPKEQYLGRYPDDPFIARAHFDKSVDKEHGYPVPYRCFYSRNVDNLFMAGRCVSVTHEALGTVRVMKTGGMMGEVVGKAASICVREGCAPRGVWERRLDDLQALMRLPGRARRARVDAVIEIPDAPPLGATAGGIPLAEIDGLVFDDTRAELTGHWKASTHEPGFVGAGYLHDDDAGKGEKSVRFVLRVRRAGTYRLGFTWRHGTSRSERVPITIRTRDARAKTVYVDQRRPADDADDAGSADGFATLGTFRLASGVPIEVTVSNEGTAGHVIVDALRLLPLDPADTGR